MIEFPSRRGVGESPVREDVLHVLEVPIGIVTTKSVGSIQEIEEAQESSCNKNGGEEVNVWWEEEAEENPEGVCEDEHPSESQEEKEGV